VRPGWGPEGDYRGPESVEDMEVVSAEDMESELEEISGEEEKTPADKPSGEEEESEW